MRPLMLALLAAVAVAALALGALSAARAAFGPSPVDYARQQAALDALARQQQQAEALAPLDLAVAAGWRLLPLLLVAAGGALALRYVWALAGAHAARFRAERRPDERGLLPAPAEHLAEHSAAALGAYHAARIAEAQRQPVPHTYSPHISYAPHDSYAPRLDYRGDTGRNALPAPDEPAADELAQVPSFAQLLDAGRVGRGHPLLLGYDLGAEGEPAELVGSWRDLYATAVAGLPGSGKSTSQRFFAAQTAMHGARFVVCDPHMGAGDDSLAATLDPLRALYLCEPAEEPRRILDAVKFVADIGEGRVKGRDGSRAPIILWVDELTSLIGRSDVGDELAELLERVAQEHRKVGVYLSASGQIWTASRARSELRDSLASVLCHRMKRGQARLLLPTEEAATVERLGNGEAVLWRTSGVTTRVRIPNTTAEDVRRVAGLLGDGSADMVDLGRPRAGSRAAEGAAAPLVTPPWPGHGPDAARTSESGASPSGRGILLDAEAAGLLGRFAAGATVHDLAAERAGTANPSDRRYKAARQQVEALLRAQVAGGAQVEVQR